MLRRAAHSEIVANLRHLFRHLLAFQSRMRSNRGFEHVLKVGLLVGIGKKIKRSEIHGGKVVSKFLRAGGRRNNNRRDINTFAS